jgi:hypothetical protein
MRRENLYRLMEAAKFHIRGAGSAPADPDRLTFCIAHFNSPEFLDATLHSIRRSHSEARIIVADASSEWHEYLAAKTVCRKHRAELHPLATRHRHTGLLNYMFRQIRSRIGIFLDQDCMVLDPLDLLIGQIHSGKALAGPRDEFRFTDPDFCARFPKLAGQFLRSRPEFVHASLMVMDVPRIRQWSAKPFNWRAEWGAHPLERYYGLTELVRRNQSDGVLMMDGKHTGYGFGQLYLFNGRPLAFHQWYSGQVYGQTDKVDGNDPDWLRAEMKRFLDDYWNNKVDFKQASTARSSAPAADKIETGTDR